jgi:hypothetical protein
VEAEEEGTGLLSELEDGCGTGVAALTCVAEGELAPQPATRTAVMTATTAPARRDGFMPSPAGAGREGGHPSIMPDQPGCSRLGQAERTAETGAPGQPRRLLEGYGVALGSQFAERDAVVKARLAQADRAGHRTRDTTDHEK